MKIVRIALLILSIGPAAADQPTDFDGVKAQAYKGDYQAQRNLAYGYASAPYKGQAKDQATACAWYLVVIRSDSPKLNAGDIGNVATYCEKLDFEARLKAERQANALYRTIYRK